MPWSPASVVHFPRQPYAFPARSDSQDYLALILKAASGTIKKCSILFGDRFEPHNWALKTCEWNGCDGVHDYFRVVLTTPEHRAQYAFLLTLAEGGSQFWFGDKGAMRNVALLSPDVLKPSEALCAAMFHIDFLHRGNAFAQPDWLDGLVIYQVFGILSSYIYILHFSTARFLSIALLKAYTSVMVQRQGVPQPLSIPSRCHPS